MPIDELEIPPTALTEEDPGEFARVWIAGGDAHISMRMGVFGDRELESWGMILADLARQVVAAYQDKNEIPTETAFRKIAEGYSGRLSEKVNVNVKPLVANN